ncbi:MAG TPA: beta-propeller fold lactonase family protein [Polyangiales bacterium]|nr:beta-propeller fold lactonase family protein [Polyangiales bacterium]
MRTLSILSTIVALAGLTACQLDVGKDPESQEKDAGPDGQDADVEPPDPGHKPDHGGYGGYGGQAGAAGGEAGKAGGEPHAAGSGGAEPPEHYTELREPSKGSAIAISEDDAVAVALNRGVGSATVLGLEYPKEGDPKLRVIKEVLLGEGSEPSQVVIGPDGDTAYVLLRKDQKLVKIEYLHTTPSVYGKADTGSEPTSLALSPSGRYVYVANWSDGTVVEYDAKKLEETDTFDLNDTLAATGYLGEVKGRPALAHPRSITITNNHDGDDADETLYVTEYYAQQVEAELADGSNSDTRKVGMVYAIPLATREAKTINLKALTDIGFLDNTGKAAGCYPNQLQSIAINGYYAYVASVCASPKGPLGVKATTTSCSVVDDCNGLSLVEPACILPFGGAANKICVDVSSVKTTTAPVISIIDTRKNQEVQGSAENLNARFAQLYAKNKTPDGQQRFPLFAGDLAFVPGTSVGYVTAEGADAVFRFQLREDGTIDSVGGSTNLFIDLLNGLPADKTGKAPIGIAIASKKKIAVVTSQVSRNAHVLDFNTQAVAGGAMAPVTVQTSALPTPGSDEDKILRGERFFRTGTGRWSLRGQGWGACTSCHGDGLSDNVTWYFARGPRQSVSLDGTFGSKHKEDQRFLNWTAIKDQTADFEDNTRDISGGVGAIVNNLSVPPVTDDRIDFVGLGHANLNGSSDQAADKTNPLMFALAPKLDDQAELQRFMQSIRSPRAPKNLDPKKVEKGQELFTSYGSCNGCHSGEKWTISRRFYTPSIETNNLLKTAPLAIPAGFPKALLPAQDPKNQLLRFGGTNPAALDQILCAIRPVDTFKVAEDGVGIAELRADMKTVSQGDGDPAGEGRGYNIPSLLGLSTGAPYFHAGNARTLEALFSKTFAVHARALAPNFLTESDPHVVQQNIDYIVQYLLSIDEDKEYPAVPGNTSLCPDVFPVPAMKY